MLEFGLQYRFLKGWQIELDEFHKRTSSSKSSKSRLRYDIAQAVITAVALRLDSDDHLSGDVLIIMEKRLKEVLRSSVFLSLFVRQAAA